MTFHKATRLTVVAETLNKAAIIKLIEEHGAAGYSVFNGGGQGAHGYHPSHRASVADGFSIVKIEMITSDRAMAEHLAEQITEQVFVHHAGIVYLDEVDVLRKEKFEGAE